MFNSTSTPKLNLKKPELRTIGTIGEFEITRIDDNVTLTHITSSRPRGRRATNLTKDDTVKLATLLLRAVSEQ